MVCYGLVNSNHFNGTFLLFISSFVLVCFYDFKGFSVLPLKESFSNKFFGKGGKQNPKSSNTPKNVSKNEKEDEKQKETKSLSKHQLKSAKKAERVSNKCTP